jgi:hypothetical protein
MQNETTSRSSDAAVLIRLAGPGDADAVRRLAALDSARPLSGPVLVAQSGPEILAAYSVEERRAVADPFVPTAGLVELLTTRADLVRGGAAARVRRLRMLRLLPARS